MYQEQERYNWATDCRINFKLVGIFIVKEETRDTLSAV